ncbi:MAG: sugar ABC transporter substrate-binding protein [Clostridia bacterium]|nr:sugar ABC transporter substrate-binding protein [Clostridia bacterium]
MTKKLLVFFIILCVFLPIGCTPKSNNEANVSEDSPKKNQSGESISLKVWIMPNSTSAEKDFMELIDPFLKENPHIKVTPTILTWNSAWDKITLSVTGGDAPDIMQLGSTWVAAIASTGGLADLTDKYRKDDFIPQTLRATVIENQTNSARYAMPWFVDTRALYYRKDALRKAGVNPEKDFTNWETFKNALKKLNQLEVNGKKISAMGMPGKNDWNVVHNFSWFIWGAGGDFLSPDNKKCTIHSPQSFEGIKYFIDLASEGLISRKALERSAGEVNKMFNNGDFATMISNPSTDVTINDNIGFSIIPKGPNGHFSFLGGSMLAIHKSSNHFSEALALLNFLSTKDAQIQYSKMTYYLPAVQSAYNDPYITSDPAWSVFKSQVQYAKPYPSISSWGPIENIFKNGFSSVWDTVLSADGPYDAKKILKELSDTADKVDKEIAKNY